MRQIVERSPREQVQTSEYARRSEQLQRKFGERNDNTNLTKCKADFP